MTNKKNLFAKNITIKNRKANFSYTFIEKYTAGIVLKGTEVKSIRLGKANLSVAYCYLLDGAIWIKGMSIAPYTQGTIYNHEETRARKLLLQRKELNKLMKSQEKGVTIIPLQLFINERGFVKIQIALARGKKNYDKREAIKARDLDRSTKRQEKI